MQQLHDSASDDLARLYAHRAKQNLRNALLQTRKAAHVATLMAAREQQRRAAPWQEAGATEQ